MSKDASSIFGLFYGNETSPRLFFQPFYISEGIMHWRKRKEMCAIALQMGCFPFVFFSKIIRKEPLPLPQSTYLSFF